MRCGGVLPTEIHTHIHTHTQVHTHARDAMAVLWYDVDFVFGCACGLVCVAGVWETHVISPESEFGSAQGHCSGCAGVRVVGGALLLCVRAHACVYEGMIVLCRRRDGEGK